MSAKKKEDSEPKTELTAKDIEGFINDYVNAYKSYITNLDRYPLHLPQFYKGFPYRTEIYMLPNMALCALFKKSNSSIITLAEGNFEDIISRIRKQDFDFQLIFPPYTHFTPDEAKRLALLDAGKDMKASKRLEMLTAAEAQLSYIHQDLRTMVELNPWLDRHAEEQKEKLDKAKSLIMELYTEVDLSKEERFSDYSRNISDAMALGKAEMEGVASALELELETALEGMEERLAALEEEIGILNNGTEAMNKLENNLSELSRNIREANSKIKSLEKNGSEDMDESLSELNESLKDNSKKIASLEKEFLAVKEDAETSKDIKETVFRDSKRTFNLNERVTELERSMATLSNQKDTTSKSEVKALEGRINVMEKNLKDYVKKVIESEMEMAKPSPAEVIVEEANVPNPAGGTIKRTTRTTTRKTTRPK